MGASVFVQRSGGGILVAVGVGIHGFAMCMYDVHLRSVVVNVVVLGQARDGKHHGRQRLERQQDGQQQAEVTNGAHGCKRHRFSLSPSQFNR